VSATVSRHNSPEDEADDAAFEALRREIVALCESKPEYREIGAVVVW
jgi:hypothetical protein